MGLGGVGRGAVSRRFRPPMPIRVQCRPDGAPHRVIRGGRPYLVTAVATSWVQPPLWWAEETAMDGAAAGALGPGDLPYGERTYYKVILNDTVVYEIFTVGGAWRLACIMD